MTPAAPLSPKQAVTGFGFVALLATISMLGPFAMDTYLPSLKDVATALNTNAWGAQQTLAAYIFGMTVMALWHGAISDAVGRRPVILTCLMVYCVGALGCWFASSLNQLIAARLVQGLAGGAGMVVARAIVRDVYSGSAGQTKAQKIMSSIMMIFSIAPAIAPVVGGYLHSAFGWRSVFGFLFGFGVCALVWAWYRLPETLPVTKRQSLHPVPLAKSYWRVFKRREFQFMAGAISFNFSGLFLYIMASPALILDHLKLEETDFAVLFLPAIGGTVIGAFCSGRLAGRITNVRQVWLAYGFIFLAVAVNLIFQLFAMLSPVSRTALIVGTVAPTFIYGIGVALAAPVLQLMALDLFPEIRGLASSFQGFTQVAVSTLTAALVAPLLSKSAFVIACGMAAYGALGFTCWLLYVSFGRPTPKLIPADAG